MVFLCLGIVVSASVLSREEALAAAYPESQIQAERIFLTDQQRFRAETVGKVKIPSSLIARYVALQKGRVVGRAYIDTHVVRSKKESLLICLDGLGKVHRVEVTVFLEPPEYLAPPSWYRQYEGWKLNDELSLQRGIRSIAGATLTARSTNEAIRRVLAIDQVLVRKSVIRK